ncbi:MAG: hypothetical protein NW217_13650 [Hyphomicrobiaceae bacterium]|nr:hypothetical protein [Hyphomicrobiaceae bacterium]
MSFSDWSHKASSIPASGLSMRRRADDAERAELVDTLGIVSCERVEADYALRIGADGAVLMTGRVRARLHQACVVTLEPVAEEIEEPLDTRFVAAALAFRNQEEEQEALSVEDVEPLLGDTVEAGRIVLEVVAAALNPFPRRADAALSEHGTLEAGATGPDNPFAALAVLKPDASKD